jgi:hypothetical protein
MSRTRCDFRLPDHTVAQLDEIARRMPKRPGGMPCTRTDSVIYLADKETTMNATTTTTYWMTVSGSDISGNWEPCKSDTIDGAMREASKRFGGGFNHHRILVGSGDGVTEERIVMRSRAMASGSRWEMEA